MNESKKVVVIGGSGFLGSHMADVLSDLGYEVVIYDLKKSPYLRPGQKMIIGDFMDRDKLIEVVKGAKYVYHFGGIADLKESSTKPFEVIYYNTLGTVNILQACASANIERFIYASSVYIYSEAGSFYRISKLASELLIEEFQRSYNLNYTILRFGSLYGPRADLRNGIYRYIHQAIVLGKVTYYGTEHDRREYIHVLEAARLSADILDDKYKNAHIMITGHQAYNSLQTLTLIKEILNNKIDIEILPPQSQVNYSVTPYNFSPKVGKKLIARDTLDFGEGVLMIVEEIFKKEKGNGYKDILDNHLFTINEDDM